MRRASPGRPALHCSEMKKFSAWFVLLSLAVLAGCSGIRLISAYDEATDRSLIAIQHKTDDFIEALKKTANTDAAAFDRHLRFYEDTDRDLRQLEFRVGSIPDNDRTIRLVTDIRAVILGEGRCTEEERSLRALHCLPENKFKGPSPKVLQISQRNINQTISAALKLELAKKHGR
jgi:hypothetical protein